MKKNNKVYIPVIVILIAALVYTLGFSTNVAYANADVTHSQDLIQFNNQIQPFNNLLFYTVIVLFLLLAAVYLTNSHKRTKFLKSNVITTSVMSGGLIVFSLINFVKLPGFISQYTKLVANNEVEIKRMKRISSLSPTTTLYYVGLVIAVLSLVYAIFMIWNLIKRMKSQKEYIEMRNEVLKNAI